MSQETEDSTQQTEVENTSAESITAPEVPQETIDKALKMGWTPKEDFKGDPAKWRPADEFVQRGENMLPILRKANEKLEGRVDELMRTVKELADFNTKTEQRAYARAVADLEARRLAAVEAGNKDEFKAIDQEITELQKEIAQPQKQPNAADDPEFVAWSERNRWNETDEELADYAEFLAERLRKKGDKTTGKVFLDKITEGVKAKFPEKFKNPRRESAPSVEGGAPQARQSGGGKTYADLPADARAACDRIAKNGFGGDAALAAEFRKNYVKQYYEGR